MFAPGTTLAQVNHIRFIENIKIYWEKYESQTNDSMFPLPDARSHIVKLQQKTNMCQMRRTTWHQNPQQNPRNSGNMRKLQRHLPGQLFLVLCITGLSDQKDCQWRKNPTCAKFSTKHAPSSTELPTPYPKQCPRRLLPDSGKLQNKARNIICKGRITSTILTASANRTSSQSETRSNKGYQSNRPGSVFKSYIAYAFSLHEMHKQSRKNSSNNTHSERTR